MPLANPLTEHVRGPTDHAHDLPPGLAVTRYPVTSAPPEFEGAAHVIVAVREPAEATTDVGGLGIVRGVTTALSALATESPAAFEAVTVTVYDVPLARSLIVQASGPAVHPHEAPPGRAVAVYEAMSAPPLKADAAQVTSMAESRGVTATPVGVSGVVRGTTAALGRLATDGPATLVATTVNWYEVPLASPEQRAVAPVTSQGPPAGVADAEYDSINAPPLSVGGVHESSAVRSPGTATTSVGDPGTVRGVTATLAALATESPAAFVATTDTVYGVPLLRPLQVAEVAPVDTQLPSDGDTVAVYPVTGEPPFQLGAVHVTCTAESTGTAATEVGASGTVNGVTGSLGWLKKESPASFVACTLTV